MSANAETVPLAAMPPPTLKRVIGIGGLSVLAVNQIVGSGIFGLPGAVSAVLGPSAVLAYVVVAILMTLVGLCLAEVGSRVSGAGGLYAYAHAAWGPVVGGIIGTLIWAANSVAPGAAVANLLVDTLSALVPAMQAPALRVGFICGLYVFLAVVNVLGVRRGTGLSAVVAALKLAPLVVLIGVGLFAVHLPNLAFEAPAIGKLGQSAVIIFFAFMGIEGGLMASGEVKNPGRTVPMAIALTMGFVAVLYIGLQEVCQGVLGPALAGSKTPIVDAAAVVFGPWGARAAVGTILLSVSGYLTADLLTSPRVVFALAEQGQLPKIFARISPRFGTPAVAIVSYAVLCALLACTGSFRALAVVGAAGTLVIYLVCCLGLLRLRARAVAMDGQPFRVPGGWAVPMAASAIILWMMSTLQPMEMASIGGMIVVSGVVYGARAWWVLPRRAA
jgi:APA family basic amino acid/polyamine antiporter